MKAHQELRIRGPQEQLRKLPDDIESRLNDGWTRSRERETYVHRHAGPEVYCFRCEAKYNRQAASLCFFPTAPNELQVTNIVPSVRSRLSRSEYNDILDQFTTRFVLPAADELSLEVLVTKPDITLSDIAPSDVVKALRDFSDQANRGTSNTHTLDKQRWEAFVIAAHRAQIDLDATMVSRWLIEEGHWPAEWATELSIEYEQARSILEEYDRRRQSA